MGREPEVTIFAHVKDGFRLWEEGVNKETWLKAKDCRQVNVFNGEELSNEYLQDSAATQQAER